MGIAKKGNNTIFKKLFILIMGTVLIQIIIFVIIILGFVIPETTGNSLRILEERVINRKHYFEMDMLQRWSGMDESVNRILLIVEKALSGNNKTIQDISADAVLNDQIVNDAAPEILYMLKRNYSSGAYLILNGPSLEKEENTYTLPGFYVRDPGTSFFPENNADAALEPGPPSPGENSVLPPEGRKTNFEFPSGGIGRDEWFYFKPLNAAMGNPGRDYRNFGYWSPLFRLDENDAGRIAYSVPLIYYDGTVFGVLGIDITGEILRENMPYEEIGNDTEGVYILARTDSERKFYEPLSINARHPEPWLNTAGPLVGEGTSRENTYLFRENGRTYYGSVQAFNLYSQDTPFEKETLVLVGLRDRKDLFSFTDRVRFIVFLAAALSMFVGVACVFVAHYIVINPIKSVVLELEKIDPHSKVTLQKTRIREIDQLANSIENMSIAVAESASKISKIIEMAQTPIGVFEYEEAGNRVFCSSKLVSILGWDESDYVGSYFDRNVFFRHLTEMEKYWYESTGRTTIYKIPREKEHKWIQITLLKEKTGTLGTVTDISREMEEKIRIEFERDYDLLTGIFNRRAFSVAMDNLFKFPARLGTGAFIMLDLDNLKYVNDTYGHEYGDEYIQAMARVLKEFEQFNGIISRRSGDEFNVFLHGYRSKTEIREIIASIYTKITAESIKLPNGNAYTLMASAGISFYPDDAADIKSLIRYADFAMYSVKHSLKGNIQEFNRQDYRNRSFMLTEHEALSRLLEKGEMMYALQPVFDVRQGKVYGYEMLMRSPVKELSSPLDILAMAKSQAKTYQLEKTTWFNALGTFAGKMEKGEIEKGRKVFFNSIGSLMLQENDLRQFTAEYKDYLSSIILEFTETGRIVAELPEEKTGIIRNFGGMVAIDDFGAGCGDGAVMAISPPDLIKVDLSVIRQIDVDPGKQQMLRNILAYARARNIKVIAEGVETEAEMKTLVSLGIDFLQGYYIGYPDMNVRPVSDRVIREILAVRDNC